MFLVLYLAIFTNQMSFFSVLKIATFPYCLYFQSINLILAKFLKTQRDWNKDRSGLHQPSITALSAKVWYLSGTPCDSNFLIFLPIWFLFRSYAVPVSSPRDSPLFLISSICDSNLISVWYIFRPNVILFSGLCHSFFNNFFIFQGVPQSNRL